MIRAGYRCRCPDSISIRKLSIRFSILFITISEYSFNSKAIDISKTITVNISLQMVN